MQAPDPRLEHEQALQAAAERAATISGPGGDADAARYRFVYRVLASEDGLRPPAGFAAELAAMSRDHEESARVEAWLLGLLTGTALLVLLLAGAWLAPAWRAASMALSGLPWPLIATAAVLLALAWLADRTLGARMVPGGPG